MNGCQTCGGFAGHHDPVAHDFVEWAERGGEDWTDPTPEQIAACAAYDPDPEQYGTAATTGPAWVGTVLESCVRDVALGRIASHSSVTAEMVAEWRRLNPGRATR